MPVIFVLMVAMSEVCVALTPLIAVMLVHIPSKAVLILAISELILVIVVLIEVIEVVFSDISSVFVCTRRSILCRVDSAVTIDADNSSIAH